MKQKIYILGLISSMILVTGAMFKVYHWPAAGIFLTIGTLLLLFLFLPASLNNHFKVNGNTQNRPLYIITYLTLLVVFTSMLFKIQHWPLAGLAIMIAIPFPFIVFLPVWLYVTSKIRNFDINNTIFVLFLLALQAVFSTLLALNVTREKLFYTLELTNQISAFNEGIQTLPVISDNNSVKLSADEVLKQIDACRQMLFNNTEITRKSLNDGTVSDRFLDSKNVQNDVLLGSSGPSPAEKLHSALENYVREISKQPDGQSLAEEAKQLFDLTNEPGDETRWEIKMFLGVYLTWILVELDAMENYVRVIQSGLLHK
jgi:hypothetical protein